MAYAADDLTPLLAAKPAPGVGFRQGIVRAWNPLTAENTVEVDGVKLTNLPVANTSEALLLSAGDVVGIKTLPGGSWYIEGRIIVPGGSKPISTIGAGLVSAYSTDTRTLSTGNTAYGLYGGPELDATISATGRALVTYGCQVHLDIGDGLAGVVYGTGPNSTQVQTNAEIWVKNNLSSDALLGGSIGMSASASQLLTGLAPGAWHFQFLINNNGGTTPNVSGRVLTVLPF